MWHTFFVVLHILSVGVFIGLVTSTMIGTSLRKKVIGTPAELASIRMGSVVAPIMSMIGSIGVLVSGIVLTMMNYSFFPFDSIPWLALMQVIFLIIMAISGAILVPTGKKILAMASAELASPNAAKGASAELRALVAKQYMTSHVAALLLLLNIILGASKSMMWVHPM